MRTIAAIACKGGSGKTTIATHLAIGAHLRGRKTLLADTDPQGSSAEVLRARRGGGPACVACGAAGLLNVQVAAVQTRCEVLIIDTPAGAEEELGHALALCDLSLLILRPTFLDLAAAVRTAQIVRRLRKPALIVLNQAPVARAGVQPPSVVRALRALQLMRLPVAPVIIRSRQAYQTALESGRSVEEMAAEPVAAREAEEFFAFVDRFAFAAPAGDPALARMRALG
ncbi:MAG TPA: AAA family ATPase [Caulobacteraceae bacterium]